ncbi:MULTISPECIES: alpha/beta hydrolase [Bacillus]|uniref:alpha/beta hydrolase n=1 Tax=Bacillus TaxID=1386 RepID=UPI000BB8761A|nr:MULTISPECIES: alpha/beta hydrolase-fold protein [Bacillus]
MFEHFEVTITPLNRTRKIRVFLPKDYNEALEKRYPVLYMHDGQNLYKDEDAGYGMAWGISDYLLKSGIPLIVVGIDCNVEGNKRLDEYGPWPNEDMKKVFDTTDEVGGEGKDYIAFIVNELKPLIDTKYRTNREDTSMAGSSMGGLISTYAACVYPHVFRKIASLSSAYWFNQKEIESLLMKSDLSPIEKFYLDIGTKESTGTADNEKYIESSKNVFNLLNGKVKSCQFKIAEGAIHNELAWKERVPEIFTYLFKEHTD